MDGAIPDLLVLSLPLLPHPLHVRIASGIAARPVVVLLEALAAWRLAAPRVCAIFTVVRAGEHVAIPYLFLLFGPATILPQHVLVTMRIATRPVLVLPVALAFWIQTRPRVVAILAISRGGQDTTIPHFLCTVLPLLFVVVPNPLLAAGAVTARPMVVLLVALASRTLAGLGLHAVHAVMRSRQQHTIPMLLLLLLPATVNPKPVLAASFVATGPMVVLPEAVRVGVFTALGLRAVLAVVRTSFPFLQEGSFDNRGSWLRLPRRTPCPCNQQQRNSHSGSDFDPSEGTFLRFFAVQKHLLLLV